MSGQIPFEIHYRPLQIFEQGIYSAKHGLSFVLKQKYLSQAATAT